MPERKVFKFEGRNPLIFEGAGAEVVIREIGEVVYHGEVPPEVQPLSAPGLHLTSSRDYLHPASTTEDGTPATYVRNWSFTYIAASNAEVTAALAQFYQRLKGQPE